MALDVAGARGSTAIVSSDGDRQAREKKRAVGRDAAIQDLAAVPNRLNGILAPYAREKTPRAVFDATNPPEEKPEPRPETARLLKNNFDSIA